MMIIIKVLTKKGNTLYSWTSMPQTSLGPWKFVLNMGSSSHRGDN